MDVILGIYMFVIGLAFGSFALVLVDRMKAQKDWVKGRSECEFCSHKLASKDLVPLISWLVQKGKCRYCQHRLSKSYPLVELFLGVAFVLSWVFFPFELTGLGFIVLALWLGSLIIMTALFVYDLRWYLLPNALVYPLILMSILHRIVEFAINDLSLVSALVSTGASLLIGSGLFWALHRVSNGRWIGDGDYRFGVALALFLADPYVTWLALFVASLCGLGMAVPQLISRTKQSARHIKIPFGPFLIIGLFLSYLFGHGVIDWYSTTFLYI